VGYVLGRMEGNAPVQGGRAYYASSREGGDSGSRSRGQAGAHYFLGRAAGVPKTRLVFIHIKFARCSSISIRYLVAAAVTAMPWQHVLSRHH